MKSILETLKESFGIITIIFAFAASVFRVMRFGEWAVILIAVCAYILYIGLTITLKTMDKEKKE